MRSASYHISNVLVPAQSMALVTVEMAKDYLGISPTDTSQDGKIGQHVAQVSAAINTYCDRIFVLQTYRDQFRAACDWLSPGYPLVTRQRPIDVATVTIDGVGVDDTMWEIDAEKGQLYYLNSSGGIAAWAGQVTLIEYDGGYLIIPEDVQAACLSWLGVKWRASGGSSGGGARDPALRSLIIPDVVSETYDTTGAAAGGSATSNAYTNTATAVPADVRDTLDNYRLWSV